MSKQQQQQEQQEQPLQQQATVGSNHKELYSGLEMNVFCIKSVKQ